MTDRRASAGGRRGANGQPTERRWYRLPVDLAARLSKAADDRVVSENLLVVRAVEEYLDRLPPVPPPAGSVDHLAEATAALDAIRRD